MTDDVFPRNTQELLAELERGWQALMSVIDRLTPGQMVTPDSGGWSPKDNLAHLARWEHYMQLHYLENRPDHEAMGIDAQTLAGLDEDGINARIFEQNRDRSATEVLNELTGVHREVVAVLGRMPFSDLLKPVSEDDPEKQPVLQWVLGNTSQHFDEHRSNIEKAAGFKA